MNLDHSVIFEIAPKYFITDSFVDYEGYSISSKGFLPTVVDNNDHLNYMHPFLSIFVHWFLRHRCPIFLSPAFMCVQLCLTLFDPMNCYPPISFFHGSFQARILCELPFPSPWDLPDPRFKPVSLLCPLHYRWMLYHWATEETHKESPAWPLYLDSWT